MITPFTGTQNASREKSSHRERTGMGYEVAHPTSSPPEPVLLPFPLELPFELVERILWFLIEIPGMATIVARVGRFCYHRAVTKIYNKINITCDTRHEILASALKGNRCLRPLVKSIVIDIGRENRNSESRTMNVKTVLKTVASNLEHLHIIRDYDNNFRLEYDTPNLRSVILLGTNESPPTRNSWNKLTHIIAGRPNQMALFTGQQFPSLTHIATVAWLPDLEVWEYNYKPSITRLLTQEAASLRFLVVFVLHGTSVITDLASIVPAHVQLVTMLLPEFLGPSLEVAWADAVDHIRKHVHHAHISGSLWDAKRCTTDVIFSGCLEYLQSCCRTPPPDAERIDGIPCFIDGLSVSYDRVE
ncbi:hypothetical protein JAAARDRAFT_80319 [Jaapia argillacea MUCL 33604]|uniref:Uncharacterized protein n=1 Tax=Jaapia argillacea MUCL 33604 TaxID=933084 RepID=A0A067PSM4_9AGAM|nr:hypothetical protein JAAARDRAFT_80319 [Jaapia argillacea MUCL 33604]